MEELNKAASQLTKYPYLVTVLDHGRNDLERVEAFRFYEQAFNATSDNIPYDNETTPDGDDLHIFMEINGHKFGIFPPYPSDKEFVLGSHVCFQLNYENEHDLRKTYDVLKQGAHSHSFHTDVWSPFVAHVIDKYGMNWCLCIG